MRALLTATAVALVAATGWWWWSSTSLPPNVLILVADDIGVDKIGVYAPPGSPPPTPNIDKLAAQGVRFTRAYAQPTCSPARAALLTGRDARSTGMGWAIRADNDDGGLPLEELTLPELLQHATNNQYASIAVGKWHLTNRGEGGRIGPLRQGFDHFDGILGNPADSSAFDGKPQSYVSWERTVDGEQSRSDEYITTHQVTTTVEAINTMPEPWLAYVSFTSAHAPFHVPPERWVHRPIDKESGEQRQYDAMVESIDLAVQRILAGLMPSRRDNTIVVFVGDNGTPQGMSGKPFPSRRGKSTMFEGGIHVPMIIRGPGIAAGQTSDALTHFTDITPTILDLLGLAIPEHVAERFDGVSLAGVLRDPSQEGPRSWVLSERFYPVGPGPYTTRLRTLVGRRFKLIRDDRERSEQLYDLRGRWFEDKDLLAGKLDDEQRRAYEGLVGVLDDLGGPLGSQVDRSKKAHTEERGH